MRSTPAMRISVNRSCRRAVSLMIDKRSRLQLDDSATRQETATIRFVTNTKEASNSTTNENGWKSWFSKNGKRTAVVSLTVDTAVRKRSRTAPHKQSENSCVMNSECFRVL